MAKIGTRDPKLGNLIKYEEGTHIGYCRKEVVVNEAAAVDYTIGTLLGTADGETFVISDPAAVDGSEEIAAVVIENKAIPETTDTNVAVLYRGPASVADAALVLGDHTAADAAAALEALGIKVQTAV